MCLMLSLVKGSRFQWLQSRPGPSGRVGRDVAHAVAGEGLAIPVAPNGHRAVREGRADRLGHANGDGEGRDILIEVPRRHDEIPAAGSLALSHGHLAFWPMGLCFSPPAIVSTRVPSIRYPAD